MSFFHKIKYVFLLAISINFVACAQKNVAPAMDIAVPKEAPMKKSKSGMTFDQQQIDLGTIKRGEVKEFEYTFTNTSEEDVEIAQISKCDCTEVLKRPYLPVKPGAKGTIKVKFDSNKKELGDDVDPVEIDIWLQKEDPVTGMPVLERIEYIFKFES